MKKVIVFAFVVFALLVLQGCLSPPPQGCVQLDANGNVDSFQSTDYTLPSGYQCNNGDTAVECKKDPNDPTQISCEVKCLIDSKGSEVTFDPPRTYPTCFDTTELKGECFFGCTYLVCTPYESKDDKLRNSVTPADAAEARRKFGESQYALQTLNPLVKERLILTPMNFFHSKCEFKQLTQDEYKKLKRKNALFLTFRLGAGRNFDEFEFISNALPPSSSICGLNPNGGVEKYTMYLSPNIINQASVCEKVTIGTKTYWKIPDSVFNQIGSTPDRINLFTTFSDCMLNYNEYYLANAKTEPQPFVPESFCYSTDYLNKPLPYLFGNDLFNKDRFVGLFSLKTSEYPYLTKDYNKDSLENDRTSLTYEGEEKLYPDRYKDYYVEDDSNSYKFDVKKKDISLKKYSYKIDTDGDGVGDKDIYGLDFLKEGKTYKEVYFDYFQKIPQYYEQYLYGSQDKQGRKKKGAEYECSTGEECISGFCNTREYLRTSCTAYSNGKSYEAPCGCTFNDCNFFDPGEYDLIDGTTKDRYLTRENFTTSKPKVYVIKPHNNWFGKNEGWKNFFYRVHLGSIVTNENLPLNDENVPYYKGNPVKFKDKYIGITCDKSGTLCGTTIKDVCDNNNNRLYSEYKEGFVNLCVNKDGDELSDAFTLSSFYFGDIEIEDPQSLDSRIGYPGDFCVGGTNIAGCLLSIGQTVKSQKIIGDIECRYPLRAMGPMELIEGNNPSYNYISEEPVSLSFGLDSNGVSWEFSDQINLINPRVDKANGSFVEALYIDPQPIEAPSRTFYREEQLLGFPNDVEMMYIVNYISLSPENNDGKTPLLYMSYLKDKESYDYLKSSSFAGDISGALSQDTYSMVIGFSDSNSVLYPPLNSKSSSTNPPDDIGIGVKEGKICSGLSRSLDVIPYGGEKRSFSYFELNDFDIRGIKIKDETTLSAKDLLWMIETSNQYSSSDFAVYNACQVPYVPGSTNSISSGFCINPYILKYDNSLYTGPSLYSVSDLLDNALFYYDDYASISAKLNAMNGFCKDIPPKFFCLGTWQGDDYEGRCSGDMAVSAFIFKDVIDNTPGDGLLDDGKFGKCGVNKDTFTGLNVSQFGVCDNCAVFNLAVEKVEGTIEGDSNNNYNLGSESSSFKEDKYPLVTTTGFDNNLPQPYDRGVGKISRLPFYSLCGSIDTPSLLNLYPSSTANWWSPYSKDDQGTGGNQCDINDPCSSDDITIGSLEYFSKSPSSPPEYYYIDQNTLISKYDSAVSFVGKYLFYPQDYYYSEMVNRFTDQESNFNLDSSGMIFRGVYTTKPPLDISCPEYAYNSSPYSTPPDFYPTRAYLSEKISNYLKRGIFPLIYLTDGSLYKPGLITDFDDGLPDTYKDVQHSNFVSKVLRDIQYIERDPKNETGFKTNISAPIGSVALVVGNYTANIDPNTNTLDLEGQTNPVVSYVDRITLVDEDCETCLTAISVDLQNGFVISSYDINTKSGILTKDNIGKLATKLRDLNEDPDFFVLEVYLDLRNIDESNIRGYLDLIVNLSRSIYEEKNKPSLYYIKDIKYTSNDQLDLFFSYLNYRKPDFISAGTIGFHFEDVRATLSSPKDSLYMFKGFGSNNLVQEGYCQITRNVLPIGGLITLKATNPILLNNTCYQYDCIEESQCIDLNTYSLRCTVRKGDGSTTTFYINDYNDTMADFIGLSLSQTGFTICPNENNVITTPSTVYKTLPVPSQYVVPITFGNPKSYYDPLTDKTVTPKACYPSSVTPQELQEIFTQGIKFATCYPVKK